MHKSENYLKVILFRYLLLFFAVLIFAFVGLGHCQVSPIIGLGNVQVFDNTGHVCPQCVIYSYQAGTTTQQATFTDATGTIQNPNPITFTSGARAAIWLTTGAFYKFVLCVQNDGSSCAPADVLFTVDQVPGGSSGGGGGGGGAPFISNSANPATSGILRLASGDSICWRNAANSANLCIAKDTSDVLSWAGGIMKFAETVCAGTTFGFDYLCADSSTHRLKGGGNGGVYVVLAGQGQDINSSDFVTQLHFGSTATPLGTAPTTNQLLQYNGTNITGYGPVEFVLPGYPASAPGNGNNICSTTYSGGNTHFCYEVTFAQAHTLTRLIGAFYSGAAGCTTSAVFGVIDLTSSTTLLSKTATNGTTTGAFTVTGSVTIPAGDLIGIGLVTDATGCGTFPSVHTLQAVYQ